LFVHLGLCTIWLHSNYFWSRLFLGMPLGLSLSIPTTFLNYPSHPCKGVTFKTQHELYCPKCIKFQKHMQNFLLHLQIVSCCDVSALCTNIACLQITTHLPHTKFWRIKKEIQSKIRRGEQNCKNFNGTHKFEKEKQNFNEKSKTTCTIEKTCKHMILAKNLQIIKHYKTLLLLAMKDKTDLEPCRKKNH
jgi:hypothetical protein